MNRNEFKKVLKPLIKECIKEVVFEEGILSGIISEVVQGVRPMREQRSFHQEPSKKEQKKDQLAQQQLLEHRWKEEREKKKKLLDATGFKGIDIFEGVEPMTEDRSLNEGASSTASPLAGVSPEDSGVDISGIMALGSKHWSKMAAGKE